MSILKPIMPYVKTAALIFLAGIALGFFGSLFFPGLIAQLFESMVSMIEELGRQILIEQTPLQGTITLFLHNFRAVVLLIVLGVIFGIFPTISMLMNGAMLGLVFGLAAAGQASLLAIIVGIVPHGIIEIPALLLGAGTGLYLGWGVFKKNTWPGYKEAIVTAGKVLALCTVMLAAAAIIEVNITPHLIRLVTK